jgi:hypothetical protein
VEVDSGPFADTPYRHVRQPLNRLTDDERTAVESYALGGFERINAALRGLRTMTEDIEASVGVIRVAIGKFPLEVDVRVTREISAAALGLPSADSAPLLVGQLFTEAGFLSASMNAQPPRSTARVDPLDLELLLPAGTPALAIGQLSEYALERELLVIDARQIFFVESRQDVDTSRWRLYGEVIPERGGVA